MKSWIPAGLAALLVGLAIPWSARADAEDESSPRLQVRELTVAVGGDILPHPSLWRMAALNGRAERQFHDFRPMFHALTELLASTDLAICHLETPVVARGQELSDFPLFHVPVEIVTGIAAAGFQRCSTASNHCLDGGTAGVDATLAALDSAGIAHVGTARSPEEASVRVFREHGVNVAHLSYSQGFNGIVPPKTQPWRCNGIDPDRIIADCRAARSQGAELVLVSLHWGDEYSPSPNAAQRALADRLTRSGTVDLIIGHHAHVVQPIASVNDVWVLYGLGNLLSGMRGGAKSTYGVTLPSGTSDGVVVTVRFVEVAGGFKADRPVAYPVWMHPNGYVVTPVLAALGDPKTTVWARGALLASLARTRKIVGQFIPQTTGLATLEHATDGRAGR